MNTYLLSIHANAKALFARVSAGAAHAEHVGDRAYVISAKAPEIPCVTFFMGSKKEKAEAWVRSNVLYDLDAVWRTSKRRSGKRELRAWERARAARDASAARVVKLTADLARERARAEETVRREHAASRDLVLAVGRGNIVSGGQTWDAGYNGETVFYIRRSGWEEGKRKDHSGSARPLAGGSGVPRELGARGGARGGSAPSDKRKSTPGITSSPRARAGVRFPARGKRKHK